MKKLLTTALLSGSLFFAGCSKPSETGNSQEGTTKTEVFTLAASEYPSWSVFDVAHEKGLINKAKGELGSIEKEYGIDIVLKMVDYDTCINMYGSKAADAVCITNIDILSPSLGRDSVAILPTSTSVGSDACIVEKSMTLESLKGKASYGLENSVSQYVFERCLQKKGLNPADFKFKNMDPQAASTAFQNKQANIESIMVWNPFVMQTLRTRQYSKVLFDSKDIPEEVIDMLVVGKDSLAKTGGDKFAEALVATFYAVSDSLEDAKTGDATYVALG
ncbi:MAG: ABC transporter substrate-binding protein, partial [Lentisphaeraceae bacterium]|nr:ABC transporter substrate-binding protein [Lentisphaeraceae bacterium]